MQDDWDWIDFVLMSTFSLGALGLVALIGWVAMGRP